MGWWNEPKRSAVENETKSEAEERLVSAKQLLEVVPKYIGYPEETCVDRAYCR